MKKAIVTTTINPPTEALERFRDIAYRDDWMLFIVGDLKTPHEEYVKFAEGSPRVLYLSPQWQETAFPKLSALIDWNCIQRRNFGFVEAYRAGFDVVATVDDDNIPFDNWGQNLLIGRDSEVDFWEVSQNVFDPLSATNYPHLWHRGFPIQLLPEKNFIRPAGKKMMNPLVQADLWNGDPDVDAIGRIALTPDCEFTVKRPFAADKISPFNSQNTFIARAALPSYFLPPGIGRMDDIWGGYYLQNVFPGSIVYAPASVYQARNPHDLSKDLEQEMIGYRGTMDLLKSLNQYLEFLPDRASEAFVEYMDIMQS